MVRLHIVLFTLIVCTSSAYMGFGFTCNKAEANALLRFKHSILDKLNSLGSWDAGQDCCSWRGVGCDNVTGNVVKLDLGIVSVTAQLTAREVNPSLLDLKYLRYLSLDSIDFSGSRFPNFIGSMKQLQYLSLSNTYFGGKLPQNLGNLTQLVALDLYDSCSSGEMERNNSLEWATKLRKLEFLDMINIDLSQALDSLNILHNLPSLIELNLDYCGLGNSHVVLTNSTVSSTTNIQQLSLTGNLFNGPIPRFIQNLSSIRYLDLSQNYFNSSIPSWSDNKVDLKYLRLGLNSFSGSFPHFIQNLSFLTYLDLSYNQFSSQIPSWLADKRYLEDLSLNDNHFSRVEEGIMGFIGRLCRLTSLDLSNNQLVEEVLGVHVNLSRCNRHDLKYLSMNNNNISGYLPIVGRSMISLKTLDLGHNNFDTIPASLGDLSSLESLDLSYNNLSVVQQVHFDRLSNLKYLSMNNNNISGYLPIVGRSMISLKTLDLSHNNFDTIPASLGDLSSLESLDLSYNNLSVVQQVHFDRLSNLRYLHISSNSLVVDIPPEWLPPFHLESLSMVPCKLNSPFPEWILSQQNISELDLSGTGIFGPLPNNIGIAMPSLCTLRLADNHINGSIPRSLCELAFLGLLDLKRNRLSGMIPDCWGISYLEIIELSSNRLSGPIPKSLEKVSMLEVLSLNDNSLEGELPLSLSNSTELMVLDVGKNNLHGEIPSWKRSDIPSLQILILRENKFKGLIPPELCSVQSLQIIDLAGNNLVGNIPQCFGHFKGMGSIPINASVSSLANTSGWSAVEVLKGVAREYTTTIYLLVNMDLSCNHLVGVIPAEIASLSLLLGLNLSHNHLKGGIPKEIGKMKSLESLDLSFNNLSGSIPESISSLDSLSNMDLSFNNLQGRIPTSRHLQTLEDPSMYMGNPGLCGDPLPKKCFGDDIYHPPTSMAVEDEGEYKHEKMWFYMVIVIGFATGFWGVIGILVSHQRWRHAYFRFAEGLVDWIYVRITVKTARANRGR